MKINEVMNTDISTVSPSTSLQELAQKMSHNESGCVIVTDDQNKIVGVITDRDIAIRCVAESHHAAETTAQQIMTLEILYCKDTDDVDSVAVTMHQNKVRRLIVLNAEKQMVGTVTIGDIKPIKSIE